MSTCTLRAFFLIEDVCIHRLSYMRLPMFADVKLCGIEPGGSVVLQQDGAFEGGRPFFPDE